jgi:hypothetical protein
MVKAKVAAEQFAITGIDGRQKDHIGPFWAYFYFSPRQGNPGPFTGAAPISPFELIRRSPNMTARRQR